MTETTETQAVKKPWYKRWWVWAIAAVLVIGGIGNAISGGPDRDANANPETTAQPAEHVTIPNVIDNDGATASTALKDVGLTVKFDAGKSAVLSPKNWTVTEQAPAAGETVEAGTTVTLTVFKPEPVIDNTLDDTTAAQHLAHAWEDRLIYGGTVHWIADRITTANEDGTFTFKIGVTIENAFGNKYKGIIEGDVGGTRDAPEILDSIMYTDTGELYNYHE